MTAPKMVCPRCWGLKHPYCDKCENRGIIPDVQLSKNFVLSELVWSNKGYEKHIANDPTVKQVDRLVATTRNLLQPLRDAVGPLQITSGFRTPELNKVIGGSSGTSAHMEAYAADLKPLKTTLLDVMHWFAGTELGFDQAILEHDKDRHWVHVGYKHGSGAQRRQLKVNDNGKWSNWPR